MQLTAVLRSEFTKVRTLRSLTGALPALLVLTTGIGMAVAATRSAPGSGPDDPVHSSYFGLTFGQLAVISFGVLAVAGEWTSGSARTSLTAVPRRGLLYAGKLTAIATLTLITGLLTALTSFLGGQALLGEDGVGLTAPGALRSIVGCALYLTVLALFCAGVAAVIRSTVGALALLVPLIFLISPILHGDTGIGRAVQFLPDRAGQQILHPHPEGVLGAWTGMAVMAAWAAVSVAAGARAMLRRDA